MLAGLRAWSDKTINALLDLYTEFQQRRELQAPMAMFCRWWMEVLRNLAILAVLRYVSVKSENIFTHMLYQVSVGVFCWLVLWNIAAILHVVFPFIDGIRTPSPKVRFGWILPFVIVYVGFYHGAQILVGYIVNEVVSAQYSLPLPTPR
jgi:hypothetical protein